MLGEEFLRAAAARVGRHAPRSDAGRAGADRDRGRPPHGRRVGRPAAATSPSISTAALGCFCVTRRRPEAKGFDRTDARPSPWSSNPRPARPTGRCGSVAPMPSGTRCLPTCSRRSRSDRGATRSSCTTWCWRPPRGRGRGSARLGGVGRDGPDRPPGPAGPRAGSPGVGAGHQRAHPGARRGCSTRTRRSPTPTPGSGSRSSSSTRATATCGSVGRCCATRRTRGCHSDSGDRCTCGGRRTWSANPAAGTRRPRRCPCIRTWRGRFDKAWRYGRLAGDRARDVAAPSEAARFYRRALDAAAQTEAGVRRRGRYRRRDRGARRDAAARGRARRSDRGSSPRRGRCTHDDPVGACPVAAARGLRRRTRGPVRPGVRPAHAQGRDRSWRPSFGWRRRELRAQAAVSLAARAPDPGPRRGIRAVSWTRAGERARGCDDRKALRRRAIVVMDWALLELGRCDEATHLAGGARDTTSRSATCTPRRRSTTAWGRSPTSRGDGTRRSAATSGSWRPRSGSATRSTPHSGMLNVAEVLLGSGALGRGRGAAPAWSCASPAAPRRRTWPPMPRPTSAGC